MIVKRSLRLIVGALLVAALAVAGTAHAKTFSMSGQWFMNRGALVDIPINGGPSLCIGGSISTGCVGVFKPAGGGVPGSVPVITAMNVNPAAFTIPPGAFGQAVGSQRVPVTIAATVIQLATAFTLSGPASLGQALAAVPTFSVAQPAVFAQNAWSNDPGQTAVATPRAAADFDWCPGVGGPGCASGVAATHSTAAAVEGIISYTAGANKFGGTMGMLLKGGGTTSIWVKAIPDITLPTAGLGTVMEKPMAHLPIPGGAGFMNPQVGGVAYGFANAIVLGSAPIFIGYDTSATNGLITRTGPPLTTGGGPMSPVIISGDTNLNWGMPWTTGTVTVMNTEMDGTVSESGTISGMGADNRTAAGKGSIVMVAGGTSHRVGSTLDFEALEVVVLNFSDGTPTPSMGPAGLATVATLMALTAGYALRGRFAGRKN
ncbi:MAG: hypothetical protein GY733_09290 [bacterium]|nr:hypothetical protein [bacterium]